MPASKARHNGRLRLTKLSKRVDGAVALQLSLTAGHESSLYQTALIRPTVDVEPANPP